MRRHAKALSAVVVAMLVLGVTAAFAIDTHTPGAPFDGSGTPNGFQSLAGVAVDQSGGDVYVVDISGAPDFTGAIDRFDSAGAFRNQIAGTFSNPQDTAVDSSGTGSDGNVYLTDTGNNLVYAFDSSGAAISSFDTDGVLDGTATPVGSFSSPCGVAVDQSNGNLFVADQGNNRVWIFDSSGRYLDRVTDSSLSGPCGIALTSTGDLYVRNANDGRVLRFNKTAATAYDFNAVLYAADDGGFGTDVATNPADDHVYVDRGDRIVEYDSGGSLISSFGQGVLGASAAVAVDATTGTVYASDGNTLRTFGPLITTTPPSPVIDPVDSGAITTNSAHLTGTVDPQGFDTTYRFEYSTDHTNWTPLADQGPLTGTGAQAVSDDATALQPNKTYFARLVASNNLDDPVPSSEESFRTDAAAPDVTTGPSSSSGDGSTQKLTGSVNPNNLPTTYWFEYGTADCSSNPCASEPVAQNADAGSGGVGVSVARFITASTPDTTYHYRLVARNAEGATQGLDQTFRTPEAVTPGSGGLPDNRGYEMVSPPEKNGGDVVADSARTRAAADGEALGFISLAPFADAIGASIATEYIAQRSTSASPRSNGWTTHAINPTQVGIPFRSLAAQFEPRYDGEFTEDLDSGVFLSFGVLDGTQSVQDVGNLYLRTNLRTPGAGFYQLVSGCPLCQATRVPLPPLPQLSALANMRRTVLAGISPDAGQVVFETVHSLTSDSAPAQDPMCNLTTTDALFCRVHVYEWDHGDLRLAGILPDGTAADVSIAGSGAGASHVENRTPHVVSNGADGHTRVFFTQPTNRSGQTSSQLSGFARIQATRTFDGNVFARVDGVTTVQLNESERPPADADAFAPALWLDASVDGTRAFFMTRQALTVDAPVSSDTKLYMYDMSKPPGAPDNLTLLTPDAGEGADALGLVGASDNGRYVYMIVAGQLERGEPPIGNNAGLFLWHDGSISFIGFVPPGLAPSELRTSRANYILTPRQARVTPDGRHMLLSAISGAGLAGYDHGFCDTFLGIGCRELYVYRADTEQLQCVSCRPGGEAATEMADVGVRTNNSAAQTAWHETNALSDDGRYVFFNTAEALVSEDTNDRTDAYVFDAATRRVQLLSSGHSSADSWFLDASADGQDAFFLTRERLVGWDVDTAYDVYDARVGGGLPEPVAGPPGCSAEACQGLPGLAPAAGNAGTASLTGPGNAKPNRKPRCTRRQRKVRRNGKTRCVKKTKKRSANNNRRADR